MRQGENMACRTIGKPNLRTSSTCALHRLNYGVGHATPSAFADAPSHPAVWYSQRVTFLLECLKAKTRCQQKFLLAGLAT